jgi:acyl-CoA synthetase (AMP-forming)/AMP-acid ligase II
MVIDSFLRTNARRVPDRQALVGDSRRLTWAQLDEQVDRAAAALSALGLGRGDRCALMSANSDWFVIAYFAVLRLGAILVPVGPRLAPPEVQYVLDDSGASMLLFAPELAVIVNRIELTALELPRLIENEGGAGLPPPVKLRPDDDAIIIYTSGTTGRPKGALFDHQRVAWTGLQQTATCGFSEHECYLHVIPLHHSAGLALLITMVMLGARNVVMGSFEPAAVLDTIERERVTAMLAVPTMYRFLLREPGLAEHNLSSWRVGIFGAAPMTATAVREMIDGFPTVRFFQQCGQTEAGPSGIYQTPEQVRARPDASGGQPRPYCEVRIVDLEGNDIGPGETGELLMRGRSVMKGYWNRPRETAEALRDGWLHTGDLVRLDDDGAMTVVDRIKDMIISGGRNVYSVEVENALASHPGVSDCAVIGRPHPDWGESIVAVVAPRDGASVPDLPGLRDHCRAQIADYKLPHEVLPVHSIPRSPAGKILKQDLRALIAG